MHGFFLFAPVEKENAGPGSGVERKVRAQHRALQQYVDCTLSILPPAEYSQSFLERVWRRLPGTAAWRKWSYDGAFDGADFLYIRQVYHDASFTRYLRAIRRRNPTIKLIYEIPTYPYDKETARSLSRLPFDLKERHNRAKAAKYMDRIVTFYGQKEIWGIPCIDLINGYDFSAVQIPKRVQGETIHILSVSATAFWHGYDRMIEGLHDYYAHGGKEAIVYHMVGNTLPEHQVLVEQYGLADHVVFHGRLDGQALAAVYEQCLLGVDILGGHRKDFPVSSTLKSREYAAYGLPLITSSPVDYLPRDYEYQLLVPYDDSPVNMESVLEFYHKIYDTGEPDQTAQKIRAYAESRCDMKITMKPVADWLLEEMI